MAEMGEQIDTKRNAEVIQMEEMAPNGSSTDILASTEMEEMAPNGSSTEILASKEMEEMSPNGSSTEILASTEPLQKKASFAVSVFNLCNNLLGSSILAMPFVMANIGIGLFGFLMILMAALAIFATYLMIKSADSTGVQTYTQLGSHAFGRGGKQAIGFILCLTGTGALACYLYVVKNQLPMVLEGLLGSGDDSQKWFLNGNYLVLIVSLVVLFPLCLVRQLRYLGYTSGSSLLFMVFTIIAIIYQMAVTVRNFTLDATMSTSSHTLNAKMSTVSNDTSDNTSEVAYAMPILACAFLFHVAILPIYSELQNASRNRMLKVATTSITIMSSAYFLIAIFGYLTFYGSVAEDVLLNYDKNDTLMSCVRLAVLVAIIFSFPLDLFSVRQALLQLFYKDKPFHWGVHVGVTFFLIAFCNILVICVPNIKEIFAVSGASTAPLLICILPGIIYCRVIPKEEEPMTSPTKILAAMFAGFGVIFILINFVFLIMTWMGKI